jgi:2-aminoadipate transaminase
MRVAPSAADPQAPSGWAGRLARRTAGKDGALTAILALANARDVINFSGGFPAPELFPGEIIGAIVADLLATDAQVALQYSPSDGIASTRDAICTYLLDVEGVRPGPGELMITSGGIDAVTLIAKSMVDPGDVVVVEEPTYLGAVSGFTGFDAAMRAVPVDEDGLVVDELAALIKAGLRPKALYTIPDYQNPTGRTMSLARRRQLIGLCRAHQILLVEDVAYRELGFYAERQPSLWSLDPDAVVQIGTFSKTFAPGVRLGWAAGPAEVVAQLTVAKQNSDQCAGALGQRMIEQFLRGGHMPAQLERERNFYRARGEAMAAAMRRHLPPDSAWTTPRGGFFSWVRVPGVDAAQLAVAARDVNVAFVPGAPFFAGRVVRDYLRLSFSRSDDAEIETGIARLAAVIKRLREQQP